MRRHHLQAILRSLLGLLALIDTESRLEGGWNEMSVVTQVLNVNVLESERDVQSAT